MKKCVFLVLLTLTAIFAKGLNYNVTVPAGTKTCYIAGEMNGWSHQVMSKVDATHYTIELVAATTAQKYKYCSGPGWAYVENTSDGNNRSYSANDIVSSWAAIYDPAVTPTNVTYNVTVPTGTFNCYFAGGATNWSFSAMQKVDDTHYKITINTATPNDYKYSSGPDWAYEEVDANGQSISNRTYNASDNVVKWRSVYNPNPSGVTYNVTVPVGTKACYIAGEMNNWALQPLTKVDETHYSLNIPTATNSQKYKYSSGPDWCFEERTSTGVKISDRTYTNADVVANWSAIWNPAIAINSIPNTLTLSAGKVDRYYFNKTTINSRAVDVWLPAGYTSEKKYAVLYMHDGQMLFDATQTWNNQEWKIDETLSQLISNAEIKDVIVVGIWNSSNRYAEYYPEKSMDYLPANIKSAKMTEMNNNPKADEYLNFIVNDVRPFINNTYSVNTDVDNTFVGGSSMGGLVSWYALCEYPNVFGKAICMSTHWGINGTDDASIPDSFRKYMLSKLPSPASHSVYFDHGTVGLDANYAQNQLLADTVMRFKGYVASNWKTQVFPGDDHNETCWANRFSIPAKFILGKGSSTLSTLLLDVNNLDGKGFVAASNLTVSWTSTNIQNIKLEYSTDNGINWNLISGSVPATQSSYVWKLPSTNSAIYKLRISDAVNAALVSESNVFTVGTSITNVTFSVDAGILINQNLFNPVTDKIYIRSSFNNYSLAHELIKGSNNIYTLTVPLMSNSYIDYKYFITTLNANNGGWENAFPASYNGNRHITVGTNHITLATVYYNDGDMNLSKASANFNVIYSVQDNNIIDNFLQRMEVLHKIVTTALQVTPTERTTIYLYKDLEHLHLAQGYPENPDWSTGSAYGKNLLIMLSPVKMGLNDALGLCAHEYTHCLNAWKTKVTLPAWLNEGVACYFGRNFSTKDWIKSVMDINGKPNIAEVFNTDMGYAYSSIVAYYIIKTKGVMAMAKFVQDMNYSDIGYANLTSLQTDWHSFLDTYLNTQNKVNVKFTVDMANMISSGFFTPATDKVYVKGDFNSWNGQQMSIESGTIYSITIPINTYSFNEYKFFTNSVLAPNNGLELNTDETVSGNRLLDVTNSAQNLNAVVFNSTALPAIQGVEMDKVYNKIEVLSHQGRYWNNPPFSTFKYSFKLLSATEYQNQKPEDNFAFDAGFVGTDGVLNISEPVTVEQKAVFANTTQVAIYYLCQSYMYYLYQTRNLPLIFKIGFPVYEAGVLPSDLAVKSAINTYGGSFQSFDVLNNRTTFVANNGWMVAGAFGEFMNIFKNWGYPMITTINASGFDVASWWGNVDNLAGLLGDFNRYTFNRFLQPDENLRIKLYKETDNFRFYTRPIDGALNFPYFSDVTEAAVTEYNNNFKVKHAEKMSYFTLPACVDGEVEGYSCNGQPPVRVAGGTAWSSGMHSTCASTADQLSLFYHMNRHELAHSFQGIFPQGTVTAWLNEGFPQFCAAGPMTDAKLNEMRQSGIDCMANGVKYFGHRPTYEDTRIYPSPDYGYYTLGQFFVDYQYRRGGYQLVKAIQMNDLAAYQSLGYSSCQAFLEDFYFDFDVRVAQKPIVDLINPKVGTDESASTVNLNWNPLKSDVKLNVLVSVDEAKSWTEIAHKTTSNSCVWNAGNLSTRFYVKVETPDNMNLSTTYGPFVKADLTKLNIVFPTLNNYLISGDTTQIKWTTTAVQNIKIDYTLNNGVNWITISDNTSTVTNLCKWIVPAGLTGSCKVRLTDLSNNANNTISSGFTVVRPDVAGGPYLYDKNTVLLLHFDNDLNNRSYASPNAIGNVLNLTNEAATLNDFGLSYKTNSALTVPHNANLSLTGDWTIEAWIKLTDYNQNSNMYVLCKPGDSDAYQSNYSLEVNPWWGNVFYGYYFPVLNSRIGVTGCNVLLNEWYHVAFIRDTQKKQICVIVHDKNRNQISITEAPYSPVETLINSKDLLIGSGFSGYIDELRISNVVRNFVSTAVKNITQDKCFEIYPNPAKSEIVIKNMQPFNSNSRISIVNSKGQQVYFGAIPDSDKLPIDVRNLSAGIYLVKIFNNSNVQTQKLIIE